MGQRGLFDCKQQTPAARGKEGISRATTQAQRNRDSKVRKARNWVSLPAPRVISFRTLTLGHRNISNFLVFE